MQIGARHCIWSSGGVGTEIVVEMTPATGLYLKFMFNAVVDRNVTIRWGDGSADELGCVSGDMSCGHTYLGYGKYRIVFSGARSIGFRNLDGQSQYSYDAAILSFVDYSGDIAGSRSGAFKKAVNLERFIAPNCRWMGQRDFAYCSKLKEVLIGRNEICYDGTFQYCSALEKYTTETTGVCWSYVWQGCTKIRELKLGAVSQFATRDFDSTPNLMDIWISDKTIDQIQQKAPSGNIVAGYSARFPWNANSNCRFHGTDGIVRADGTVLERFWQQAKGQRMNRNYGKLVGGEIEYAPAKITKDDGTVISNPSAETYLAAGWKPIVDEPPAAEPGHSVQVSGWDEADDAITRIYKQVPDETPSKSRVFSKLKLVAALKEADKWVLVKTWIEERGYWDFYLAAHNFREDNPLFAEALAAIKNYARMSDEDAEAILSKCIYEED